MYGFCGFNSLNGFIVSTDFNGSDSFNGCCDFGGFGGFGGVRCRRRKEGAVKVVLSFL